jgi:hypothetical protein
MSTPASPPHAAPLRRATRLLAKARDAFYEKRYAEAVERCQEALAALLPEAAGPAPTPEQQADLFLASWSAHLPVMEAGRVAAVFTFFLRRKEQFRYERGRPLPRREWWEMLTVTREESGEMLTATRTAIDAVRRGLERQ